MTDIVVGAHAQKHAANKTPQRAVDLYINAVFSMFACMHLFCARCDLIRKM